jgi:hypothetical protein
MEESCERLFSRPVFAFDRSELQMGRHHLGLQKKFAPTRINTHHLGNDLRLKLKMPGI